MVFFAGLRKMKLKKKGERNNLLNLVSKSHFYFLSPEFKTVKIKPAEILGLESSTIFPTQKQQCGLHNETKQMYMFIYAFIYLLYYTI